MPKFLATRGLAGAAALTVGVTAALASSGGTSLADPPAATSTPIQHLVVIYQENVSFDHYFGTYPDVNGLTDALLTNNPNGVNPRRYDPSNINDVLTCDQDHNYNDEQRAFDDGAMDKFPQTVGAGGKSPEGAACVPGDVMNYYDGSTVTGLWNYAQRYAMSDNSYSTTFGPSSPGAINVVSGDTGGVDMAHAANSPSIATIAKPNADVTPDGQGGYSLTSDAQPYWDDCSTRDAVAMSGKNVGDLLNAKGLSWGWFQGGFRPTTTFQQAAPGQATSMFLPDQFKSSGFQNNVPHASNQGLCDAVHPVGAGLSAPLPTGTGQFGYKDDYIAHHEPFQYYASTANPHHLTLSTDSSGQVPLSALRSVGTDTQHYSGGQPLFDTPNHNYDMSDFDQLVAAIGRGDLPPSALPAVSYLKAPGYEDGHAAYSDPIDEQRFLVNEINALQKTPAWKSTAVVIAYDDSDGWYDHQMSAIVNPGDSAADTDMCTNNTVMPLAGQQGRCGHGPRQPLLVVSPWAASNVVDHTRTDQSSIVAFIEDNWGLPHIAGSADQLAGSLNGLFDFAAAKGQSHAYGNAPKAQPFLLDPATGQPTG